MNEVQTGLVAWIRRNRMFTQAAAYISGNFLQQAVSFIMLLVWAAFLTGEDYGIINTLAAYAAILSVFLGFQLHAATTRFYFDHRQNPEELKRFVGSVWFFQAGTAVLVVIPLMIWGGWWEWWQSSKEAQDRIAFWPYLPLALTGMLCGIAALIPMTLFQAREQAGRYVLFSAGRLILSILLGLVFVAWLRWGAHGMLLAQTVTSIVFMLVVLRVTGPFCRPGKLSWKYISQALAFSLPFVPHALAAWLLAGADRVVVEKHVTLGETGAYGLAFTMAFAVEALAGSVNQAFQPHFFRLMKDSPDPLPELRSTIFVYGMAYGGICVLGVLFAGDAVALLLPERHHQCIAFLAPLLFSRLWSGWYYFACTPLFYHMKTAVIPVITVIVGSIAVGLNLLTVPLWGAKAAAWNAVVGSFLLFAFFLLAGRRSQKLPFPWLAMAGAVVCAVAGCFLAGAFAPLSGTGLAIKAVVALLFAGLIRFLWTHRAPAGSPAAPDITNNYAE